MPADPAPAVLAPRLGVHLTGDRAVAAVFAAHADAVTLCLLGPQGERRVALHRTPGGVWTGDVDGVRAGQRYGLRVDGPWDPAAGHRHDPAKLLLDPRALVVAGEPVWGPELFSHAVSGPTWRPAPGPSGPGSAGPSGLDSAASVRHGVLAQAPVADAAARPRTPWERTVVYEAHLRGLTMAHPAVPPELRGTWAGLAHPAVVEHLVSLGVTAVELLPVQAGMTEVPLARRGQENAWGYSTLSWWAPEPRYTTAAARAAGPGAVLAEVAGAVAALHAAGLEVLLDVVYNHSCEGAAGDGPTVSLRGIDAASHYRLDAAGRDVDSTGCGNSLDFGSPAVVALALDSLRHWVTAFGVDGFRFDLAPSLARGRDGAFDPDHPFLLAAASDPVLSDVKLVAEPWDLGPGGWRTGSFPAPFAEWNDAFRDDVRGFWLASAGRLAAGGSAGQGLRRLARRLTGSADVVGTGRRGLERGPLASVSFVTAHDGFTLADLTAYEHKHNEANGEAGRDGTDHNLSWNHGAEGGGLGRGDGGGAGADGVAAGDADALLVRAMRRRSVRSLLATLLVSAGVPMLTAGDETGRSQGGNNNPYCLDDATTWVSWDLAPWQEDLLATTRQLLALRRDHEVLRPVETPLAPGPGTSGAVTAAWSGASGTTLTAAQWDDESVRTVQVLLAAPDRGAQPLLLVLHGLLDDADVVLPPVPDGLVGPPGGAAPGYRLLWDSAVERPLPAPTGTFHPAGTAVPVHALSLRVYRVGD